MEFAQQAATRRIVGLALESRVQDRFAFEIDPFRKMCLLGGLDEISLTEKSDAAIGAYEKALDADRPWMRPAA